MTMNVTPMHPGLGAATISVGSGLISFFTASLIVVQWSAGMIAILAGIASLASVIKHWNRR